MKTYIILVWDVAPDKAPPRAIGIFTDKQQAADSAETLLPGVFAVQLVEISLMG